MFKSISAIATASFLAAAFTILMPGFSPDVKANAPAPVVKSDRADARAGETACAEQGWPYYQAGCMRDRAANAGRAKAVRLVTADRIPIADPRTDPGLLPQWPAYLAELQVSLRPTLR
ncbi:MAG: hypothetical protein HXY30_07540 [Pseudorhodoplanes sp.]|nr:hypothetical protein [Pseudorhodoplanes sp.]